MMTTGDDGSGYKLKELHHEAVPAALEKAERYRLLNEPREAESICRDILRVEPENQRALITLLLALTDQLRRAPARSYRLAKEFVGRLRGEYERAYYSGIICERRAKAMQRDRAPRAGEAAYEWLREAMDWYEKAEELSPPDNDDPLLRWNACVRTIRTHRDIEPAPQDVTPQFLE